MGELDEHKNQVNNEKISEMLNEELGGEDFSAGGYEDAVRELYQGYGRSDDEYLVDGAVLHCDRATAGLVLVKGLPLILTPGILALKRETTVLRVSENASYEKDKRMATIKDHVKIEDPENGIGNIKPFMCNCKNEPNDDDAYDILRNQEYYKKNGTCCKLMKLNNDWENMIRDTQYHTYSYGTGNRVEEAEGVTKLSMLFCSHGGLITPVTSGQLYDTLDIILCKNLNELTDEDLRSLGYLFQIGDENVRLTIFDYLFFPPLMLDGESYAEEKLANHISILNNEKIPHSAARYVNALNKLEINNDNYSVQDMIDLLSWNQEKINATYDACKKYSIETGILVSPKLALAIIGAEGTGSYDTNGAVASCYKGGNGPQHDFDLDTNLGLDLIYDKISGFIVYKDDYIAASPAKEEKHLFTYICDQTPKLGKNTTGVYATDRGWINLVDEKYQFYSQETRDKDRDYVKDYETILEGYDKDLIQNSDIVQYEFIYDGSKVAVKE